MSLQALHDSTLQASWYDPRTGKSRLIGAFGKENAMTFTAPTAGPCSDWVLVVDGAGRKFPMPGLIRQ